MIRQSRARCKCLVDNAILETIYNIQNMNVLSTEGAAGDSQGQRPWNTRHQ